MYINQVPSVKPSREAYSLSKARIFVGQLEPYVTEADLFPVFSAYGKVLHLNIVRHSTTVTPHQERRIPTAFVWYETTEEADAAIAALHNKFTFTPPDEDEQKRRYVQISYADRSPKCTNYGKVQKIEAEAARRAPQASPTQTNTNTHYATQTQNNNNYNNTTNTNNINNTAAVRNTETTLPVHSPVHSQNTVISLQSHTNHIPNQLDYSYNNSSSRSQHSVNDSHFCATQPVTLSQSTQPVYLSQHQELSPFAAEFIPSQESNRSNVEGAAMYYNSSAPNSQDMYM